MSILLYNPLMDVYGRPRRSMRFSNSYYTPTTDVYESNDEIIVKMDLPGVKRDNILIEATFNELELRSNYPEPVIEKSEQSETTEKDQEDEFIHRYQERTRKDFYRKFKFNKPVNTKDAKVTLEDGVLTISLPLSPEAKKINLQIN